MILEVVAGNTCDMSKHNAETKKWLNVRNLKKNTLRKGCQFPECLKDSFCSQRCSSKVEFQFNVHAKFSL